MSKSFKCNNFGNCVIADADQVVQIEITAESEPRCEKCNQPLEEVRSGGSRKPWLAVLGLGFGSVFVLALAWVLWPSGQATSDSGIAFVSPGEVENAQVGKIISFRVQTNPEASVEIADGMPTSATFNRISGVFEWTPTVLGDFLVTFNAEADGLRGNHVLKIIVTDGVKQPKLQPESISGAVGQALPETIVKLVGRPEPVETDKIAIPGIQWDIKRQALSGAIDKEGTYRLPFFAMQNGKRVAVGEVKLIISGGTPSSPEKLTIVPNQSVRGEPGKSIAPVSLRANRTNVTFKFVDALPAGLVLDSAGSIIGTPIEAVSKTLQVEARSGTEIVRSGVMFEIRAQPSTDFQILEIYEACNNVMSYIPRKIKSIQMYERDIKSPTPDGTERNRQVLREIRDSLELNLSELNTQINRAKAASTSQQWHDLVDRKAKEATPALRDEWMLKAKFLKEAFDNPGTPEQLIEMGRKIFVYE